jgi:hypothetical protein
MMNFPSVANLLTAKADAELGAAPGVDPRRGGHPEQHF